MSFDTVAPWYETLERLAFGDDLQRCRIAALGEIAAPQRALVVGDGNGRFLCELLRYDPDVEVDCVDGSGRMLQLAQQRVEEVLDGHAERVRFLNKDITSWRVPERRYDLIVTNFFLDCFSERSLIGVIRNLGSGATEDATWLVSEFCVPEKGMARFRARGWLAAMYFFFRVAARIEATELIDPTPFISAEGFGVVRRRFFRDGMLKAEVWRRTQTLSR